MRAADTFNDLNARWKFVTVSLLSALPIVALIIFYVLPTISDSRYDEREAGIRQVVDIAFNLMKEYDERIQKGEFSEAEGKKRYLDRINKMRYNKDDYFWVNDLHPRMVFHPFKKELNGKDLTMNKDPNGKQLFVEMVKVCNQSGEGFVAYEWPKPGFEKPVPKMSFVRLYKPWGWMVGSGVYIDDIEAHVNQARFGVLGGMLTAILIALTLGFIVGGLYKKSLSEVVQKMDNAELHTQFNSGRKDEIGALQRSFDTFVKSIRETLIQVSDSSAAVSQATFEIKRSTEELAAGSQQQSSQARDVATAVAEMTSTITENSKNANVTTETARQAREAAVTGGHVVKDTISGMKEIADVVIRSAETVRTLGRSSDQIGEIVSVINDIADQTNLLALNAAIEAARAGDQGRGFAVVADEVRKLAERTTKATKEIEVMIRNIQRETKDAVSSMEVGTKKVNDGITLADKAGESLQEIVTVSQDVTNMVVQIATASAAQTSVSEQINRNIEGINFVAQESSKGALEIARTAETLNHLTGELEALLAQFHLGERSSVQNGRTVKGSTKRVNGTKGMSITKRNGQTVPV
ncbi:MAG: methyl-accepting chemotaxis protein [Bacteroidetes bacterium]|nr:methyl-accepting chemotaxis protein [Bacteroidota bacterium]